MAEPKASALDVRLDAQTFERATRALEALGLPVNQAVDLLLNRIAQDKALPLEPPLSDREVALAREDSRPRVFSGLVRERLIRKVSPVLARLGLSIDDAVGLMLTRVAKDGVLPLSPNAETRAAMEEARREEVFTANTVEEFLAALNADDADDQVDPAL